MGVIEVFYDRFDGLTVAETIDYNGKKKVKRIHGDMAKLYFNVLSNQRIKGRKFADNCEFVLYADKCIKIYDYKFIREYQLLDEYLSEVDRQVKENKERLAQRVKRKNKYKNAKVLAFGLAILILGSSVLMAVSSKATNNTGGGGNSGYSQTTAIPNYDITINIGKPTGGSGSQLYGPEDSFDVSDGIKDDQVVGDVEQDDVEYIFIDYYDRSVNDKAQKTRELYGNIIEKYANMYGLDPSLVLALATQERGVHSSVMDRGGATGLMQIQNSIWVGKSVTAYNFEKGCKETCNTKLAVNYMWNLVHC